MEESSHKLSCIWNFGYLDLAPERKIQLLVFIPCLEYWFMCFEKLIPVFLHLMTYATLLILGWTFLWHL